MISLPAEVDDFVLVGGLLQFHLDLVRLLLLETVVLFVHPLDILILELYDLNNEAIILLLDVNQLLFRGVESQGEGLELIF